MLKKVTSAKQSASVVKIGVQQLKELVDDSGLEKGYGVVMMKRKFWFRVILYAAVKDYDVPVCFLGNGEDYICKPYKNSLTIDLNEGENIDITMNIENDMDKFFNILEERKIEVLVMEGVATYLKKETISMILKFVTENKIKIIFTAASKHLLEILVKVGGIGESVHQSSFEDYEDILDDSFNIITTEKMLDFLGMRVKNYLQYYYIHNFSEDFQKEFNGWKKSCRFF